MTVLLSGATVEKINYCKEHSHSCWEIVIVTSGSGTVCSADENIDFFEGCAYIIPPNVKHTTLSTTSFEDVYIHTEQLNFKTNCITTVTAISELPFLAKTIHSLYLKRHQGYTRSLNDMLRFIVQLMYDSATETNFSPLSVSIRNYISENIENPDITMEDISRKFSYNSDYIRRCFKKDFNTTPLAYLNRLRMSQARKLLLEMTIYSVEDIARLCGYTDQFYFSRAFKKEHGISPQKYRKK